MKVSTARGGSRGAGAIRFIAIAIVHGLLLASPVLAQGTTQLISVGPHVAPAANSMSVCAGSVSQHGRYVVFTSWADNLVPDDHNGAPDAFLWDRRLDKLELVSVSTAGVQGLGASTIPTVSADGRFVAFGSTAANLVPGDGNGSADVFVRDRLLGTTERVSVTSLEKEGHGDCGSATISDDGRFVVFTSLGKDLVTGIDGNGTSDVFVRDRLMGTTKRLSNLTSGNAGGGTAPQIARNGSVAVFYSFGSLLPADAPGHDDVYLAHLDTGALELVSVNASGVQANARAISPDVSDDGRWVAFTSDATNLVAGTPAPPAKVFVKDRTTGAVQWLSEGYFIAQQPAISGDGSRVVFGGSLSGSTGLIPAQTVVADVTTGERFIASLAGHGEPADENCSQSDISPDGLVVVFQTTAGNLAPGMGNQVQRVFAHIGDCPPWPPSAASSAPPTWTSWRWLAAALHCLGLAKGPPPR